MNNIRIDISESIATLTIDRPAVKNALNLETVKECHRALDELAENSDVGVLIITGAGETSFVSGADINDIRARTVAEGLAAINSSLFAKIERFPKPVIAAINGYALGGGCELALACDIRVAADTAKFGQPELGLGIIPGAGATQRLPRIVGLGWAKHLVLTGDIIDAKQALEIGLVTAIMPASQLQVRARELAKKILRQGPLAAQAREAGAQRVRARRPRFRPADRDARAVDLLRLRGQAGRNDRVSGEAQAEVHRALITRCRRGYNTQVGHMPCGAEGELFFFQSRLPSRLSSRSDAIDAVAALN